MNNKNQIDIKDVPQELLQQIRQQFEADPRIRNLRIKQNMAQRNHNYIEALNTGKQIEFLYDEVVSAYLQETEKEYETIDLKASDLPKDDRKTLVELVLTMFLAADIIDTAAMDFNDVMHRTMPDYDMEQFDDLLKLAKAAKSKIEWFAQHSDYMKDVAFGDKSDNMYGLLRNKARSLMNKKSVKKHGKSA